MLEGVSHEKAFEEDEELVWSDIHGDHVAHILIVSANFFYFLSFFLVGNCFGVRTPLVILSSLNLLLHYHLLLLLAQVMFWV